METRRIIIWDLENTLYPYTPAFGPAARHALAQTIEELQLGMSAAEALNFSQPTYPMHTISRLTALSGRSQHELFLRFHDNLKPDFITSDPMLAHEIRHCPAKHAIITHSSRRFTERALAHMGLSEAFPPHLRITSEDMGGVGKNDAGAAVLLALQRLGAQPCDAIMVDDRDANLKYPRELGLIGILVGNRGEELDAQYCHHYFPTAGSFLRTYNLQVNPFYAATVGKSARSTNHRNPHKNHDYKP